MPGLASEQVLAQLLTTADRALKVDVLVVVAHPDDEVIGAGAQLPRWPTARFLHVTDGAPANQRDAWEAGFTSREAYAQARRGEVERALSLAGVGRAQIMSLGLVDQEASLSLADLAQSIAGVIREISPDVILTHPYEGGHPDHDATCFAVHTACRELHEEKLPPPPIVEMTSYHNRGGMMATGEFLPARGSPVITVGLSLEQQAFKQRLFNCFTSQQRVLSYFPIGSESFRLAPAYHFTRPPHPGILYYELFDWGMNGNRWRALAREALIQFGRGDEAKPEFEKAHVFHGP